MKPWESEVAQLYPTFCDPMDCSPPGFSIHGIFQAWVLEWVAISFSRGSSQPRNWTWVSSIAGRRFTIWAGDYVLMRSWGWSHDGITAFTGRDQRISSLSTSHGIKRCLLLGRKALTNLDSIWKSRDITLPTKVRLVKAMVFPVVKYGCESWTIKKSESRRIDAF